MIEKRLTNLEFKFSHMDDLLDQLNKIVTTQELTIDKLQNEIIVLKRTLSEGNDQSTRTLEDDVPPHY